MPPGKLFTLLALFSNFLGGALGATEVPVAVILSESANTISFVLLIPLLVFRFSLGLRIHRYFYWWIPFLLLFTISWFANQSDPKLAVNFIFSLLKPFLLGIAASTFLKDSDLKLVLKLFLTMACIQAPFLGYQVWKLGYLTGGGADQYTGALGDAHLVGIVSGIASLWLLGRSYWEWARNGVVRRAGFVVGLGLFFIPILCEAKYFYLGSAVGFMLTVLYVERGRFRTLATRFLPFLFPMAGLIIFFGLRFFLDLDYITMFQLLQKVNAYHITFTELPERVPHALWLGTGPGTYGGAIAQKYLPPLAAYFFGSQVADMEAGGTLMGPFSELNGAIGEFGLLGPLVMFLPYFLLLGAMLNRLQFEREPIWAGALILSATLLILSLLGTPFLPALMQHSITMPAVLIGILALTPKQFVQLRPSTSPSLGSNGSPFGPYRAKGTE